MVPTFLTINVTILYSNIEHKGIECVGKYPEVDPEIPRKQKDFLLKALEFILTNNYFTYD